MIGVRVAWAFLWVLLVWSAPSVSGQVVVYENSAEYSGFNAQIRDEYGDELMLEGTARVVTKLQFEYFGDFFSNLDERGRVRIYANDGPFYLGRRDYPTPGSLLWESPQFILQPGGHTMEIPVPSIKVPDRFTWTVQFTGVSMQKGITTLDPTITNDVVGLLFYGPATIGESFDDFWQRLTGNFTPVYVSGPPKNNFATAITAVPEAVIPQLTIVPSGKNAKVRFPASLTNYVLQIQFPDGRWVNTAPAVKVGPNFERVFDPTLTSAIFRLKEVAPAPSQVDLTAFVEGDVVRLRWPASAGGMVLQSSTLAQLGTWVDRPSPGVPVGDYYESVLALKDSGEIFRLREGYVSARLEFAAEPGALKIRWSLAAKNQKLQSKSLSGNGSWVDVAGVTPTEMEYYMEAAVPTSGESRIFRLKP